ncbi:MAG: DNA-3-methyladenine glycosylase 2 family protein, partial [Holdemanella sp.]|nr:DNA-3-methyladenine glycosylase 2 family protein [Holdemanella sp.]
NDEEIIKELSSLPGIGTWTAEMLMLHSLDRMDILSYKDLAIQRGICKVYHHKELDKKRFERYKKRFSPYGSIASIYFWEVSKEG